ncbi:hypothetical protein CYY_005395 [Polysphondylium violaceum]|uniref:AN1-type domain-containing protein n=1 Tax=Polysphondylium violaceum TaxID=133409 RepID=A0A8J4PTV4_9MYCE|nr:hypothetical protein CYY_005395 [Polysphondylium violaceum]
MVDTEKDLDKVGVHCNLKDCHLLDFLPFTCDGCRKLYCVEHKDYAEHSCPSPPVIKGGCTVTCDKCDTILPVPFGKDDTFVLRTHISQGCKKKPSINQHKCTFEGCSKSESIKILCPQCKNNFCLKHRFERDHKCKAPKQNVVMPKPLITPHLANMLDALRNSKPIKSK